MSRPIKTEIVPSNQPFIPPPTTNERGIRRYQLPGCGVIFTFVLIAWGLELLDHFPGIHLDRLGLRPRQITGLIGIFTMPWLHGGFGHLISNTLTFIVLGYLVLAIEQDRFFRTTFLILVLSGLGTWLIGRGGSVHIGASALIYGYFGYLLGRSFFAKKMLWALFGIILAILYGSMVFGIFPQNSAISWEGHLTGFVAGIWLSKKNTKQYV